MRFLIVLLILLTPAACSRQPDFPPEIIEIQKTIQKNPADSTAYKDLIKRLQDKEFYNESLSYSEKLIEISPDDYYGYLYAGYAYEKIKEWDNAERYYKETCERFPEIEAGYYRLAVLQYEMGDYKDCIANLEKAISLTVSDTKERIKMMNFLAEAYYYNNEPEKAYPILDNALELDPFNIDILYNYGVWLLREGKYNESIQFLEKLVSQNPQEEFPYMRLGKAYYSSRDTEKAEKAFRDASRFDSTVKIMAEIIHVQDMYSTYEDVNTAAVKVNEKYDYKYGDKYYVRGVVENIGLETAQWVSVIVRIYDKKDNLLAQKAYETSPRNIRPEQYVFFKIEVPYDKNIAYVKVEPNWHKRAVSVYLR